MKLSNEMVKRMTNGRGKDSNINSVVVALNEHGARFGLDQPHRLAHVFAQIMHESMYFHYDREVWDGKGAQARYDTRTDLGNTPERDGDGELFKGHGPIQVTGRANHVEFRDWCREFLPDTPDFEVYPELINTDPYEGLTIIWYWSTRNLNRFADDNNLYTLTKRVNGGTNGLAHRYECYDAAALVLLGFAQNDVRGFQVSAGFTGRALDGDSGPNTRKAMHAALVALDRIDVNVPSPVAAAVEGPRPDWRPVAPVRIVSDPANAEPMLGELIAPDRVTVLQSTTIWAQLKQWAVMAAPIGYSGWSALQEQDPITRSVVLGGLFAVVICVAILGRHIIRERVNKWAEGDR